MHKIALQLNHQNDGYLCWLSDRSWSEASVACHHDLSTVKHAQCDASQHVWRDITELLHVQLTRWYHTADMVYQKKKKKHSLGGNRTSRQSCCNSWLTLTNTYTHTHRVFHMTKSLFCHFFQCMEVKLNEATFLSTSILLRQTFVIKQHPLWSTNSPWIWSQKTFSYFLNLLLLPVRSSSQRNHRVIKVFINKCILAPFQCKHWGSKPTISVSCSKSI